MYHRFQLSRCFRKEILKAHIQAFSHYLQTPQITHDFQQLVKVSAQNLSINVIITAKRFRIEPLFLLTIPSFVSLCNHNNNASIRYIGQRNSERVLSRSKKKFSLLIYLLGCCTSFYLLPRTHSASKGKVNNVHTGFHSLFTIQLKLSAYTFLISQR